MDKKSVILLALIVLISGCKGGITGFSVGDTIPPVISINQTSTTDNSAFISWSTDEESNSTFNSSITVQGYSYSTYFNISLNSLNQNTTYNYVLTACDNSSNCDSVSSSFTTNITPDTSPPAITVAAETSETSANITWSADESSNSTFIFNSESTGYGFATSFTKQLTGLSAGTQYSFTIISCDSSENCNTTNSQFTTQEQQDTTPPSINIGSSATKNSASVAWSTDESSNSTLVFNSTSTHFGFATSFSKQISGLAPNTQYSVTVTACDSSENCGTESHSFTTSESLSISVIGEQATHDTAVINWTTSEQATASFRYSNVMITYSANTEFSAYLEELLDNSTYIYNISAYTATESKSLLDNFTTAVLDDSEPGLSANVSYNHDSANFTWSTDESANSTFRLGDTVTEYSFDTSFSKELDSLEPETEYAVNITVCDSAMNCNSTLVMFNTSRTPDTTEPTVLISSMQVEKNSAIISWTVDEPSNCTIYVAGSAKHYEPAMQFTHTAISLNPETTYPFNITACDNSSNCAVSSSSFTTKPAQITPAPEPQLESPAPVTPPAAAEESSEGEEAPRMGGFMVQEPPEAVEEKLTFFEKIKKLTSDHMLLILLSLILTLTIVFNISYLRMTKSGPVSSAEELIAKANSMIRQGMVQQAYRLYPHIMAHYKKIESSKEKRQVHRKLSFLYAQLQLHTALSNAETMADQYYNDQLLEDSVPLIMQQLDQIPVLLENFKKFLPKHHHEKAHSAVMDRHSRCLTKIYQKKKGSSGSS